MGGVSVLGGSLYYRRFVITFADRPVRSGRGIYTLETQSDAAGTDNNWKTTYLEHFEISFDCEQAISVSFVSRVSSLSYFIWGVFS